MSNDIYKLPYDLKRAGPKAYNRFQLTNIMAPKLSKFNAASTPVKDLEKINLEKLLALEKKAFVYVETLEGSLIIEPTEQPVRTLFSYYLMKQMKIHAPRTRVICFVEKEMKDMIWQIERFTFVDVPFQKKILEILNRPYWILREYYPFVTLDQLSGKNSNECLNARFPGGRKRLIDFAFVSSIDMLLNNSQRMPNMDSHKGNPLKMKFAIKQSFRLQDEEVRNPNSTVLNFDELLVMNTEVNPINKGESTAKMDESNAYIIGLETKVETMCLNLREIIETKVDPLHQTDYHWPSVAKYNRFIKHFTGYDMTTMAEFQILLGVILGFQMLVRFGMNRINRIIEILSKRVHKDPQGIWDRDLRSIHLPFFEEILHKIDKVLLRFDALLAYSHSVTVGQFSYQFGKDLSKKIMKELVKGTTLEDRSSIPKIGNYKAVEDPFLKAQMKPAPNPDLEELMKQKENLKNRFMEVDKKLEEVFKIEMGTFKPPSLDEFDIEESIIEREIEEQEKDEIDETARDLENDLRGGRSPDIGNSRSILKNRLDRSNSRMRSKNNVSFANNVKQGSLDKSKSRKSSKDSRKSKKDKKKRGSGSGSRESKRSKKSGKRSRDVSKDSKRSSKSKKGKKSSRDRSKESRRSKKDSKKRSRDKSKDSKKSSKSKKSKKGKKPKKNKS